MDALARLGIPLVEDACQAHGATLGGRPAGTLGAAAAFSFYPTKNLGALGEGGAVTTSSSELAACVRALRDHGQTSKHRHDLIGTNARLDAIQCAALSIRLRHLPAATARRRALAAVYRAALADVPRVRVIADTPGCAPAVHLMVVRVPAAERDRVRGGLADLGVETAVHYPTPIHLQPAFAQFSYGRGDLPVAEHTCDEIISLPLYPEMPDSVIDVVVDGLRRLLK
jgi:dTDP-4-amino-4,6-dideoxygalactose transaminase